jgi:hypothetical protein
MQQARTGGLNGGPRGTEAARPLSHRMPAQYFAAIIGVLFLLAGIIALAPPSLVPGLMAPLHEEGHTVAALDGRLFGLFPVNWLHDVVHVVIGGWGIAASYRYNQAIVFSRALVVIYGLLAIIGVIPGLNTMFGMIPLYGHDVWLHAGSAVVAAYFGFIAPSRPAAERAVRR